MAPNAPDFERLTLIVQRLLDADLILPEEANAVLEMIAATADTAGQEPVRENEEHFLMLEALVETKSPDIPVSRRAQEIVRQILHTKDHPP